MLKDLDKLKGFDFSKKIIYTDNLSFDDLFFMSEKWFDTLILDYPNKVKLHTSFEDMNDMNYKILYYRLLHELYSRYISHEVSKDMIYISTNINCSHIDEIHIENNITDVALSNNHIVYCPEEEYGERTLEENINMLYTMDGLKNILRKYNLPVSGKKGELIDRLISNLSNEQLEMEFPIRKYDMFNYRLTDEGKKLVEKYSAYKYRDYLPFGFKLDEFILICDNNPQYSPEDILFCLCYQNWVQIRENSSPSEEYKSEVGNVNAFYKSNLVEPLVYYHDLTIAILEKIISDGDCDNPDRYKFYLEDMKESYEMGNY